MELRLYKDYGRKDVQQIFAPDTAFNRSGMWGLQEIVAIPNRTGDFVFFVTLGHSQGIHLFDEGVTEKGVVIWQSEPQQGLADEQIRQLIMHDELKHSIYLFLRTKERKKYTYLGKLKYLSHDAERERPVYFKWQILDWDLPHDVLLRMNIILLRSSPVEEKIISPNALIINNRPISTQNRGTPSRIFRSREKEDYSTYDAANQELNLLGELLVKNWEVMRLEDFGRKDLAARIVHVSQVEGDGAGYAIHSYTENGEDMYIGVKTSIGSMETPFFMSSNELEFSKQHPDNYYLYRVYKYDKNVNSAWFYIVRGDISQIYDLTPSQYRVSLTTKDQNQK